MAHGALQTTAKFGEIDSARDEIAAGLHKLKLGQALSATTSGSFSLLSGETLYFAEFGPSTDFNDISIDSVQFAGRHAALKAFRVETFAIHAAIQRARPTVRAILLLRAPRLASWGLAGRTLPIPDTHRLPAKSVEIPLAHVAPAYIRERLEGDPDAPALLLPDGRAAIWGDDIDHAVQQLLWLEETAQVARLAERLGGARAVRTFPVPDKARGAAPKYAANGPARGSALARSALSQAAVQAKALTEAAADYLAAAGSLTALRSGSAAVRLAGRDRYVISGFDSPLRDDVSAPAVVGFDDTIHEGVPSPGTEDVLSLYRAVLQERPDVQIVLHARTPYLAAWALAQRALPLATFHELSSMGVTEIPVTDAAPVRDTLRHYQKSPALLLAHRGVVAWGGDLQSAARLISALEETARFVLEAEGLAARR